MPRIIAFGCSNTYGEGLEKRITHAYDSLKEPASKYAWPQILGNLLGIGNVVNRAEPGSSNKHIWERVMSFEYQKDDIVIIHWTFIDRDCFFGLHQKIGPWQTRGPRLWLETKAAKLYYRYFYSETDRTIDLYSRADHVDRYLKSKNIKCYHMKTPGSSMGGDNLEISEDTNIPSWCSAEFLNSSFEKTPRLDDALDGDHAGRDTHKSFAKLVYTEFKQKNT